MKDSPVGAALQRIGSWINKDPLSVFLAISSVTLAVVFFNLLGSIGPSSPGRSGSLSEVTKLSSEDRLTSAVLLDQDSRVVVTLDDGTRVWAAYPKSDAQTAQLLRDFEKAKVPVVVDQQSGKPSRQILVQFLVPILLLVTLFALFSRIGQNGGSAGFAAFSKFAGKGRKRNGKVAGQITFSDVAGAGEAVTELREIRDYLANPQKYASVGALAPRGVLLVGPPGTGKTLLAKATSGEADAAFFSLSGSEFVESLVGVGAARVRDLFRKARKMAPAIIFIDEIDAAGRRRGAGVGQGNDEREQTLNQLLVEMDGFDGGLGLVVMAATNRPDILDPALLRPGRFDRQITIDVPDVIGRQEILELHCGEKPLAEGVSMQEVARLTPGFSGAELANVINEASLLTVRGGEQLIGQDTLLEAIDRVVAGPARNSHHVLSDQERWIIAIHEASHAVVTRSIGQAIASQKVSIIARGRQLGTAAHMLTDRDQIVLQEPDMRRQLVSTVAGVAGERLAFGYLSTGVHDDLHAATAIARSMVTSFGMSERLGLVTIGERSGEVFLGASLQDLGSIGPGTLELIDDEVERFVGEAELIAAHVLDRNWSAVTETAEALLAHETLSGVALDAVLSTVQNSEVEDIRREVQANGSVGGRSPNEIDR